MVRHDGKKDLMENPHIDEDNMKFYLKLVTASSIEYFKHHAKSWMVPVSIPNDL
jgi:hypothetical protein